MITDRTTFKAIRVPESVMEDMKTLKAAYEECYGRKMTFEAVLRRLMDCVENGDPAVHEVFRTIKDAKDYLQERLAESKQRAHNLNQ